MILSCLQSLIYLGSLRILITLHTHHYTLQDIDLAALSSDLCIAQIPAARQILDLVSRFVWYNDLVHRLVLLLAYIIFLEQGAEWEMHRHLQILYGLCSAQCLHGPSHLDPSNSHSMVASAAEKAADHTHWHILSWRSVSCAKILSAYKISVLTTG